MCLAGDDENSPDVCFFYFESFYQYYCSGHIQHKLLQSKSLLDEAYWIVLSKLE